ncbi:hypothetical protein EV659_102290 [Rhodothalassium salexigens DSM 2132]|uniref:Uncharacterized protein n=1 Tax=Rhodothalassium salexigens DSM 2132 TaxID=1188247 RepID=A0A4R2PQ23_RHOSA|nr:hypothetical protein [Rhodothalassium salexigens]MBB4210561.1 hypothetical protein [Rhodothalassium salexigens DSM 2132]MBK1638030.1 hypothetical protein [Rhodothalassium salexigens DSM 2132]TCP37882.1 hypothetical protein EV659_102290 [Rhodothalassium salexigens DSM 2132]
MSDVLTRTDLRNFLGSSAEVNTPLKYYIDGHALPDAKGVFTEITDRSATLHGQAIMIFGQTIVDGTLALSLTSDTDASLTVTWTFDGSSPMSHTIHATYAVNPNNPHRLDFKETQPTNMAVFYIQQVPALNGSGTDTEIFTRDGMLMLGAVLAP